MLSCQYKSAPDTQKTYLGFVVDSSDVHFYSKVFSNMFFDKDCDDTDAIRAMGKALYDELVKMNPVAKEDVSLSCRYEGNKIAFYRAVKGNPDYDNEAKLKKATQCLIDNGIEPDEAKTVLQAIGYILFGKEFYPADKEGEACVNVAISINEAKLKKAEQCLIDNGIASDEAETVLQALGYILLDKELYSATQED